MRKELAFLCGLGILVLAASPLYAGGIINKSNQSADYMRTLNRSAATDYADIAVYNPAGIMQMENGAYVKLDALYFDKDYSNTIPSNAFPPFNQPFGTLSQDKASVIPAFFAIFKQERWAGFFAFTIPAGGGELEYNDGTARTVQVASGVAQLLNRGATGGATNALPYNLIASQREKVKDSVAYGFSLGGSYAINKMWSVAAAARYVYSTREFDGQVTIASSAGLAPPIPLRLDVKEDDGGLGGYFGVNFAPNDRLNTALTFYTSTDIKYEREVKKDTLLPNGLPLSIATGFRDGSTIQDDIPGQLGFGISYKFLPQLNVALSYVLYLEKSATIQTFSDEGDSWDLGITAEYTFSPQWKASIGYLHTDIKLPDDQQIEQPEEPKLDADTIGAGIVFSPTPKWDITFGGAYVNYKDVTDDFGINYDKTVWNLSAGVQWKFF
ncbi:MAG: outer membrane beta-barrel protein [Desulfobacterales bacterium]|jgi:long-chain fatty acid transport protein